MKTRWILKVKIPSGWVLQWTEEEIISLNNNTINVGGVRTHQIDYDDGDGNIHSKYFTYLNGQYTSGNIIALPAYSQPYEVSPGLFVQLNLSRQLGLNTSQMGYGGENVYYDKVQEFDDVGLVNGHTEYEYSFFRPTNMYHLHPYPQPDDLFFRNGKLNRQTSYDANGGKVYEKTIEYIHDPTFSLDPNYVYRDRKSRKVRGVAGQNHFVFGGLQNPEYAYYEFESGLNGVYKVTESTYGASQTLTTEGYTFYDDLSHTFASNVLKIDSHGDSIETFFYYPMNYEDATPSVIEKLTAANQVSMPIETLTKIKGQFVSAQAIQYRHESASDILVPDASFNFETNAPVATFNLSSDGEDFDQSSQHQRKIQFLKYDDKGNLLSLRKEDDITSCFIWGYNQTLPVAKLENVSYSQVEAIFYAGFHAGTAGLSASDENDLRTDPGMANALITTYTYQQGIGHDFPNGPQWSHDLLRV